MYRDPFEQFVDLRQAEIDSESAFAGSGRSSNTSPSPRKVRSPIGNSSQNGNERPTPTSLRQSRELCFKRPHQSSVMNRAEGGSHAT